MRWMIYKNKKEYDQKMKDLNAALYESASKAKAETGTSSRGNRPTRDEKSDRNAISE
ncbi:MAG: hypothetical protein R6W91_07020 [Thermoplasmata archaeon]